MSRFTKSPNNSRRSHLQKHDDEAAPKFWRHETSGILAPPVQAYLHGARLTAREIEIMQAYLSQWVQSEGWMETPEGELAKLRERVVAIKTQEDIHAAVMAAVSLGMDPL